MLGPQYWALHKTKSVFPRSLLSAGVDSKPLSLSVYKLSKELWKRELERRDIFRFDVSQSPQQTTLKLMAEEQQEVVYRGQGRAFQAQGIVFKGWVVRVWCPSREKRSPLWLWFWEVHKDQMIQSFVGHHKVLFQVQRQYFKILKRNDLISFCFEKIILDVFWRLNVARIETGDGPI